MGSFDLGMFRRLGRPGYGCDPQAAANEKLLDMAYQSMKKEHHLLAKKLLNATPYLQSRERIATYIYIYIYTPKCRPFCRPSSVMAHYI